MRANIKVCRNMEDDLASLDILEKKTEIFKIFVEIEKDQISNAMLDKQIDLKAKKRL